jgi:hypothetical protein
MPHTFDHLANQISPSMPPAETAGVGPTSRAGNAAGQNPDGTWVDVLNAAQAQGPPGVTDGKANYPNVNDPAWDDLAKWENDPLQLLLQPKKDMVTTGTAAAGTAGDAAMAEDPCMSNCQQKIVKIGEKCNILKERLEYSLKQAGCPMTCEYVPPDPTDAVCNIKPPEPVADACANTGTAGATGSVRAGVTTRSGRYQLYKLR